MSYFRKTFARHDRGIYFPLTRPYYSEELDQRLMGIVAKLKKATTDTNVSPEIQNDLMQCVAGIEDLINLINGTLPANPIPNAENSGKSLEQPNELLSAGNAVAVLPGSDAQFIKRVIHYLESKMQDCSLDISLLAGEMNMSSSNLYRKIRSITGLSSKDFVMNHKMTHAARLLLTGSFSVKEIAYMTGFSDARYFSTRFKKYFSCTPTQYGLRVLEKSL
jgi:AraC-like DNA-binding protein